jgi:hypothetical protein
VNAPTWQDRERIAKVRDIIRACAMDGDAQYWPNQLDGHFGDLIDGLILGNLETLDVQRANYAANGRTCTDDEFLDAVALLTRLDWLDVQIRSAKRGSKKAKKV